MKELIVAILFILWCILTLVLTFSMIGLTVILRDGNRSTWMQIGLDMCDYLTK